MMQTGLRRKPGAERRPPVTLPGEIPVIDFGPLDAAIGAVPDVLTVGFSLTAGEVTTGTFKTLLLGVAGVTYLPILLTAWGRTLTTPVFSGFATVRCRYAGDTTSLIGTSEVILQANPGTRMSWGLANDEVIYTETVFDPRGVALEVGCNETLVFGNAAILDVYGVLRYVEITE